MSAEDVHAAAARLTRWWHDPVLMVREEFGAEPDEWQKRFLRDFADPEKRRQALKACKGPGKTTALAWAIWNFLLCYGDNEDHAKGAATSITGDNLRDNLWTELAKWRNRSKLLQQSFEWTATRIYSYENPDTHFFSARTWQSKADKSQQANTLAGLHGKFLLFVLDESGGMPDAVMVAAEAGLSTWAEGHFIKVLQAGNPTHTSGPLYRACTAEATLWSVIEITGDPDDPMRSPRINVQWAREQIGKHGRNNAWVLVNVFGKFPPSSINALLGPEEIRAAIDRERPKKNSAPVVLGVDVARYGDDSSVIAPRQGFVAHPFEQLRNLNSIQGAGHVIKAEDQWESVATFVDATGGFGTGWIDQLEALGRTPIGVVYSAAARNERRYYNKRTEMHFELADWVKAGGCLPDDPELVEELSALTYTFDKKGRMQLVEKDQVKDVIGRSPDKADALAQTFAEPVAGLGVVGSGWKTWTRAMGDTPEMDAVVMAVYSELEEGGGKWCATVWGVWVPRDPPPPPQAPEQEKGKPFKPRPRGLARPVPAALLLEVATGESTLPEFAKRVRQLYREKSVDFALTLHSPKVKAIRKHLWHSGMVTRPVQYDPITGPHSAGEVIAAGRAWVPERAWAKKVLQDLRRYPAEGTEVAMHGVGLALTWLRWHEDVRPVDPDEQDEDEKGHENKRAASIY